MPNEKHKYMNAKNEQTNKQKDCLYTTTAPTCPGKGVLVTLCSDASVSLQPNGFVESGAGGLNPHPWNLSRAESPS